MAPGPLSAFPMLHTEKSPSLIVRWYVEEIGESGDKTHSQQGQTLRTRLSLWTTCVGNLKTNNHAIAGTSTARQVMISRTKNILPPRNPNPHTHTNTHPSSVVPDPRSYITGDMWRLRARSKLALWDEAIYLLYSVALLYINSPAATVRCSAPPPPTRTIVVTVTKLVVVVVVVVESSVVMVKTSSSTESAVVTSSNVTSTVRHAEFEQLQSFSVDKDS